LRLYSVIRNTAASRRLYDLAAHQGGFFTARQAREAGYEDNVHPYHVRSRNWIREARGVYRLSQFPLPSRPDLMVWQLWSRNRQDEPQGVFSHVTALSLHELSDLMPAKLHMTVPPGFRRMAAIPEVLQLHHSRLADRDVQTIDGVRVTTPLRTLLDVIAEGTIAEELLVQAVDEAFRRGAITRSQMESARVSTRARQRIDRVLKQIADDGSTAVRNRRRVSNRARGATQRTGSS
jgi:predicted transcriptional regulator of viral defense system